MSARRGSAASALPLDAEAGDGGDFAIGIYAAYLHTLGGGENLIAVLAQCLEAEIPRARIDLIGHTDSDMGLESIVGRFGVDLRRTRVRRVPAAQRLYLRRFSTLRRLLHERDISRLSAEYDLFLNSTIFSLVPPRSRRSVYICMFPVNPIPLFYASAKGLRRWVDAPYVFVRRHAIRRFIGRYDRILSISQFTRSWVRSFWQVDSLVLHPPVDTRPNLCLEGKKKRILGIGRFFPGNHNKKHDVLIESFARLLDEGLEPGWELHLAGGRTDVVGTDEYIAKLRAMAWHLPVHIHVDASRQLLELLLASSSLFWHATGFGEDEQQDPDKLEHFGMSTVEAMSHGCVPLVYAAGGQTEIVEDGVSGYLWRDRTSLIEQSLLLARDSELRERLARAAHQRSQCFSRAAFAGRVRELLSELLPEQLQGSAGPTAGGAGGADRRGGES